MKENKVLRNSKEENFFYYSYKGNVKARISAKYVKRYPMQV